MAEALTDGDATLTAVRLPPAPAARAWRASLRRWGRGLVVPLLLLVVWEAAAQAGLTKPNLLPAPSVVVGPAGPRAPPGGVGDHILVTLTRVFLGFLLGAAAATLLGGLTGYSRTWRGLLDPLLQSLRSIPSIAWVPLFILWLGIFEASKITLIAVGVFFPVYLSLVSAIQDVDRKLVEVGRVHNFSGFKMVRRILLPATLPAYIVGLRGGLGLGWMFVVAAEYMGASEGVGYLLVDGQMTGRADTIIAAIILFALLGKASDAVLAAIGRRLVGWQDSFERGRTGGLHA
ncbi:MAG: ABC transporter permease [Rhodospirillaceae bacterium]|nr:ABC transporter permease [Rhodospirillaceae bacterium]